MRALILATFFFITFISTAQEFYFRQMPADYGSDIQHIHVLFQSSDQMVWMGTDHGLYSFDGRSYRPIQRPDGVNKSVTAIAECPNHEIWAGYEDGYVHVIKKGTAKTINTDSIKNAPVSSILFNNEGIVFVSTYGAGVWKLEGDKFQQIQHPHAEKTNDIYDALVDKSGRLWLGTDHGILIQDPTADPQWKLLDRSAGLPDEIVTELHELQNGDIWIGFYDYGFGVFRRGSDSIHITYPAASEDGVMTGIESGYDDEVWLASDKSVINYSKHHLLHHINLPGELQDRIDDILFDRTGNLWIASGNKLFMTSTQLELRDPGIEGIQAITEMNNILWLGSEKGLYSLELRTGKVDQHLANEDLNILSLYHDDKDVLWIGTFGQGLYVYEPATKKMRHLTEENGISNNSILNIDGTANTIWLATLGGVTEMTWLGNPMITVPDITLFAEQYDFPAGYVYDIHVGKNNRVWFGTDGKGLYVLNGDQLRSITKPVQYFEDDSFDLRTIYSITGDEKDNVWVSASKGNVLKLDAEGRIVSQFPTSFGSLNSLNVSGKGEIIVIRDGMIQINDPVIGVSSFNPSIGLTDFSPNINSTAKGADGSVWIADTDKVLHYKPVLSDSAHFVQMLIVDMTPGDINADGPVRLQHDSNFIDFRFTGLWYKDPQSVRYRYMLKGHDQDWIYTREGRAVYSKLAQGNYEFIVAGSHNDDFTYSIPLTKKITVLPPFYLTWWFIIGMISLITFLVYRIMRDRIRRLNRFHELEKEKTTLQLNAIQAQVNPHFLFNSFNTLSGIIEEDQEAAVDYVDQLSSFFRGVLLHRDAELISLVEEIEIMRNYLYILKKRYGDNISINEEITSREGYIAPLTLQLLVENAIKHNIVSTEKPLRINIIIKDGWLTVTNPVQPKFQSMTESTGFGLSSLLTRYQYLTGKKIDIIKDRNNFTVKIPIIQLNNQA